MVFKIYITDPDDHRGRSKSKSIIDHIENDDTHFTYGQRDFLVDGSNLDKKRNAVQSADMVIIVFTDVFLESAEHMYDAALTIAYERRAVVIDCGKKATIPPLLKLLPKISGRKSFEKILKKLSSKINEYRTQPSGSDWSRRRDEALGCIRDVEKEESLEHEKSLHNRLKSLKVELENANDARKIARRVDRDEGDSILRDLMTQIEKGSALQKQLQQTTDKYKALTKNSSCPLQCRVAPNRGQYAGIENSLEESTDMVEDSRQNRKIKDQINQIYMLILKLNNKEGPHVQPYPMPSELRSFCKKYTKMIGPRIRQFGRSLNLTTEELDLIEEYRKHGYEEMFWQTITIWQPKAKHHGTFATLLDALQEIGVDIGGKPMPRSHVLYMHEKIPYLLQNIYRISDLIPHLLSTHVLTETTQMYVTDAKTDEEMMIRLVNLLTTRSNGIQALCDALEATEQSFIANDIKQTVPPASPSVSATECSDYSTDTSCGSLKSNLRVAIVEPTSHVTQKSWSNTQRATNPMIRPMFCDQHDPLISSGHESSDECLLKHDEDNNTGKDLHTKVSNRKGRPLQKCTIQ